MLRTMAWEAVGTANMIHIKRLGFILALSACATAGGQTGSVESGVDTSVWYCADNIYHSADAGVAGAQQAGNVSQSEGALRIVARKQTVQYLPTQGGKPVTQHYTIG